MSDWKVWEAVGGPFLTDNTYVSSNNEDNSRMDQRKLFECFNPVIMMKYKFKIKMQQIIINEANNDQSSTHEKER